MNGILNIDKPAGMTSHDVVSRVRRITRIKRVGHAGTLDPDATGVLLVCVGPSTRIADLLADGRKSYRCTLTLGAETDSEDASGVITSEADASHITIDDLRNILPAFVGEIQQIPPMVSAVHFEGKRLYELARKGVVVDRPSRTIFIESIDLIDFTSGDKPSAILNVACGKGAYIRTLCADIGRALGVGGHMAKLRRTSVGAMSLETAQPLDTLSPDNIAGALIPAADALKQYPCYHVTDDTQIDDIMHGRAIRILCDDGSLSKELLQETSIITLVDKNRDLIALAHPKDDKLYPYKVFSNIG